MRIENLGVYQDYGKVPLSLIQKFERYFGINLPISYIELIKEFNAPRTIRDHFNYYDSYLNENTYSEILFKGFETVDNSDDPPENIFLQYIYNDEDYGYKNIYAFGRSAEGNWVCFDYRDDPQGNEPKICIVIHDEYDDETGKHLLFPVADNFEQFLDGLYEFDWEAFNEMYK